MKKQFKFLSIFLLTAALVFTSLGIITPARAAGLYEGKTVILHSNDVHGNIAGYAYMYGVKLSFLEQGAEVITVDAGDFSQGTTAVSINQGRNAIKMMNAVGYDVATIGNHEFDYGVSKLKSNLKAAKFTTLSSNIQKENGKYLFKATTTITTASGLRVGFIGFTTPKASTSVNPIYVKSLTFLNYTDLYKRASYCVSRLSGDDVIIGLSHLGIEDISGVANSYDLYNNVSGIDFIIDGHSHTVMTSGVNGEPIQSTGTKFANIGVIVIDNETKTIENNYLIPVADTTAKALSISAKADRINKKIEAAYGTVFATSEVALDGERAPGVRTQETNLGDLVADAMCRAVAKDMGALHVEADHLVAITNGGGLRASVSAGDITMNDIMTVLPFGNTLSVVYVSGEQLLEVLEASTFLTPNPSGGFPQISGMNITIDTGKEFLAEDEPYAGSLYYGPKKINRVTINDINGKAFNPEDTYAVITNTFCANGGDAYFRLADSDDRFDTGLLDSDVVADYIRYELKGCIGEEYSASQGRITLLAQ